MANMMDTAHQAENLNNFSGVSVQDTDLWFALYEIPYREEVDAIHEHWGDDYDVGLYEEIDMASDANWEEYERERAWWGDIMQVIVEETSR